MNLNKLKKKQATKEVKLSLREKKHQANLRKNNGLYFQIGLIATLFIVFGVFQLRFVTSTPVIDSLPVDIGEVLNLAPVDYIIEENIQKKVEKQPVKTQPTTLENPKIIENDDPELPDVVSAPPVILNDSPRIDDINVIEEPVVVDKMPIGVVKILPIFPGCEKFKDKKKQFECFSKRIGLFVNKKFQTDVAAENNLNGRQRIAVTFTIDKSGKVVDVKAMAKHPELIKEAIKAVNLLPKMTPAKHDGRNVSVTYALPIIFQVD